MLSNGDRRESSPVQLNFSSAGAWQQLACRLALGVAVLDAAFSPRFCAARCSVAVLPRGAGHKPFALEMRGRKASLKAVFGQWLGWRDCALKLVLILHSVQHEVRSQK